MKRAAFALVTVTSLLGFVPAANAATILFTSRALWEAAVTDFDTLLFEGAPDHLPVVAGSPYSELGVDVIAAGGLAFLIGPDYDEGAGTFGFGTGDTYFTYAPGFAVTGQAFTAAGFDFRGYGTSTTATLLVGFEELALTADWPDSAFLGFITDTAVSDFTVGLGPSYAAIDNLSFATEVEAVPEPGTLLLVGGGAAVAWLRMRRRR